MPPAVLGSGDHLLGLWHRSVEAQAAALLSVCLIASWALWAALSRGQEFHSSQTEEPPCSVCLDIATCQFYFLLLDFWQQPFPLNNLRTTVTINISLTPLLSHLFSRLRNHDLCSFSKYRKCSRLSSSCTFSCFSFLFYPCNQWPGLQTVPKIWGWDGFILRVWDLISPKFHGFSINGTGQTRLHILTVIDTVISWQQQKWSCFAWSCLPHNNFWYKFTSTLTQTFNEFCGAAQRALRGEKKPQHIPQDICPWALVGEMFWNALASVTLLRSEPAQGEFPSGQGRNAAGGALVHVPFASTESWNY